MRSAQTEDGGFGELLISQTKVSDLVVEKIDSLIGDVIAIRLEIENANSQVEQKPEGSRLQGYLDLLESCDRLRRSTIAVLRDEESLPEEKDNAREDLEAAYKEAQLAVGMLRGYSGRVAAIAIPESAALISSLLSLTGSGPAALKFNLQNFLAWAE